MKKVFYLLLLISFGITIMMPVTGVHIHKLASVCFLLLSFVHTISCRKKIGVKCGGLWGLIMIAFVTGIFGMIWEEIPSILVVHRMSSIALIFSLAIHIFKFYKRMWRRKG